MARSEMNPRLVWLQCKQAGLKAWQVVRRPRVLAGCGVVIALGVGLAYVTRADVELPEWSLPEPIAEVFEKPSIRELSERIKADPNNAQLLLELGHARFEAGYRAAALRSYARALKLSPTLRDERLFEDLVASFGEKEQKAAADLIAEYKLVEVSEKIDDYARHKSYRVRWGALRTLERIGRVDRADYVAAYVQDLGVTNCDVRRRAVDRLGDLGTVRVVDELRAADKKDKDETPWYRFSCLRKKAQVAEQKILARSTPVPTPAKATARK